MSDESPTAVRVPDAGIRELYTLESRWQSWLDVEAALARAQADLGIVPDAAADRIAETAHLELLDRGRIDEATRRTSHPLVPLVWELARVAGDEAGGWVHWGSTTQNIVQTGDILILRRAHRAFTRLIADALDAAAELADRYGSTPIAGRTHGQHAIPTTFGVKVATWIDELIRHADRLREVEPRIFVALLGGAVGNFAAAGPAGPATQERVAELLGLTPMDVPARSIGDHLAEYVTVLGLLASTVQKIGREIYTLMKTEFEEVREPAPPGTVGSSTMPQKRNPQLCQDIISRAAIVRSAVPLALEAMQMEHESDRALALMMQEATKTACVAMGDMLPRLVVVLQGLEVDPERMLRNLDLTRGLIMSESIMMRLGERIGRQAAHDVVYESAQRASIENSAFGELLAADPRVTAYIGVDEIAEMLSPQEHVGLAPELARAAAVRGRAVADAARATLANTPGTDVRIHEEAS